MRKRKILVIDDDSINLQIAKMVLEQKLPCEVFCVDNGIEGIDFLRRERVDLVLLDILMPDPDGIETLAKIRADSKISETPVIMLSATGTSDKIQRVTELGVRDYIKKPFMPKDLIARVQKELDKTLPEEILIVSGNEKELHEMQQLIEDSFSYAVFTADSAAAAEEILRRHDIKLVIASANMKFLEGFELLAFLAADEKFGAIPFALTSDKNLFALIAKVKPSPVEKPEPAEKAPLATHAEKKKIANVVTSAIGYELDVRI